MFYRSRVFMVCVVGLLLASLWALALPVAAQGGVQVIANANLSLRAAASADSARLGTVPYQTELAATAISPDRGWVAVVYNGQGGWITLEYTGVLSGSLGALNVSEQVFTAGGGGPVTSSVNVSPTVNLRYRTEPSLDVRPSGAIPFGETVPALGLSADGLFVLVNYLGQNVWVYREYVQTVSGSLDSFVPGAAPVSGGPSTGAPSGDLRIGSTVTGTLSSATPFVNYSLGLSAGDVITVTMVATSGDLDPFLYLYNAAGSELAHNDDIDLTGGNYNAQIANFTAPATGLYTIRAARYEGNYIGAGGQQTPANTAGDYQLSVTGTAAAPQPAAPAPTGGTTTRSGIFIAWEGLTTPHFFYDQLPPELRAASIATAKLIVYLTSGLEPFEACPYVAADGSGWTATLDRVRVRYDLRLVDGATGVQLDQRSFVGEPAQCPNEYYFGSSHESLQGPGPLLSDLLPWFLEWLNR